MWLIVAVVIACIGAGGAMAQDAVWQRVVDPTEHAFSLDVPRGWTVTGGMRRRSPIQPHAVITLRSPGGATQMVLGSVEAISYSTVTPLDTQLGFREGMLYSPGSDHLMKMNYRAGRDFAEAYGLALLAHQCQNVQLLGSRALPEASVQGQRQPNGLVQGSEAGDAFFTCAKQGQKFDAYVFSRTEYTGQPGTGYSAIWNADATYTFMTPAGQGMAVGAVLSHIVHSLRIDQQWLARQLQVSDTEVGQALANANAMLDQHAATLQRTFADTAAQQRATQDEMHRLLSGFDEYQTATGDRHTVPYGAATNWWSNNRRQTLGTQGPRSPGMMWQEMNRVPLGQQ